MNVMTRLAPEAALIERDFAVPDIRCAGCISKLEQGLVRDARIRSARVNFTEKRVHLAHTADARDARPARRVYLIGLRGASDRRGAEGRRWRSGDEQGTGARVAVSGFAMMNIMLLSVSVWSGATGVTRDLFHWLSALIALPTIAYAGRPFFRSAWRALKHGHTNMDVPISIGVTLATALSLYETATHGAHAYFDSAVMLLFFLLCGRWLDSVMRDRARGGVTRCCVTWAPAQWSSAPMAAPTGPMRPRCSPAW